MENNEFLNKYKDQVEYIGKDGIIGIMKSAHFEINKSNKKKLKKNNNENNIYVNSFERKNDMSKNTEFFRDKSANNIKSKNDKIKLNAQNLVSRNFTTSPIKSISKIKINISNTLKTEKNNNKKENIKINKNQGLDSMNNINVKNNNNNNKDNHYIKIFKSFSTRNPEKKDYSKTSVIKKIEVYSSKKQNIKLSLNYNNNNQNTKNKKAIITNDNQKDKKNNELNNEININQNRKLNQNIKTKRLSNENKNQNSQSNAINISSKSLEKINNKSLTPLPLIRNKNSIIKKIEVQETIKLPKISIRKYNSTPTTPAQLNNELSKINNEENKRYYTDKSKFKKYNFKNDLNYINDITKKTNSLISEYQINQNKTNNNVNIYKNPRSINITMPNSDLKTLGIIKEEEYEGNTVKNSPQREEENNYNKNKYFNLDNDDNNNYINNNNTHDDNIKNEISDMEKLILQRQSYNTDFSFLS